MASGENIIDVKKIVEERKEYLKIKIEYLKTQKFYPKLCAIVANSDEASKSYVKNKRKLCEEMGIIYEDYFLKEEVTNEDVLKLIASLNNDTSVHAILVQLPLYKHLDEKLIIDAISTKKDVDGFTSDNLSKLNQGKDCIVPCTAKGIISILESIGETFEGKHAVVVGRSNIVGKPVSQLLLNKNCTVTVCHSKTKDLELRTKEADILIVAVGKPHLINADMVKEGATVIDVGINSVDGKIVGDVDTENVSNVAKYVTKVPGGVGLTTVLSLAENVLELIEENEVE